MTFVRTRRRKMPAVSRPSVSAGQHGVPEHVADRARRSRCGMASMR